MTSAPHEARTMAQEGHEPLLKKSRWCVLKRIENLTSSQKILLRDLLRYNLQTVRAYLLKEDFQQLLDSTPRPPGPASFWISGAIAPCGPASSP